VTAGGQEARLNEKLVRELVNLPNARARARFLGRRKLYRESFGKQLNEQVRARLRVDTKQALALVEVVMLIARRLRNQEMLGRALRSKGNGISILGGNQKALVFHKQALAIFEQAGNAAEQGRTLIALIQPLILLGRYDPAFEVADRAQQIFTELGDRQRLAHVEINRGNIYHRQDRFEEGLACYERAYEALVPLRDSEGLAVALYNMAVCLITLNDFPRALATYQRAREMCVQQGMALLVTQADYNIAYLYYLRGEYGRAIEMLRAARVECEKNGDAYVLALCDFDLSEIYLELNLSAEALETAHDGYQRFQKLGMGYEEAKCQANEAMALRQLGKPLPALDLFAQARPKFVREKNLVWPWLIDLYQAVVLYDEGRLFEARRLCSAAADFFDSSFLPGKAVLCHLLLARIRLRSGDTAAARSECARALERLEKIDAPVLRYQAEFLMGQAQQESGDARGAYSSFQRAREALETLRSSLHGEELKIAFMKNRLEVYESLVELCLDEKVRPDSAEESFGYMELAKSRSLAELLVQHGPGLPADEAGQSTLVRRIREMREDLNWYYRRIESEQLRKESPSRERIEKLQNEALAHENELLRAFRELPPAQKELDAAIGPAIAPLSTVREFLPPDTAIIEYFTVKNRFVAAILTSNSLEIVPVTPVTRVANLLRMVQFQMSKFRLGSEYMKSFANSLLGAVQAHLGQLYQELVFPLRQRIGAQHLVIVPHGLLHYVPFHALYDGQQYLVDSFTISYAPSSSVFAHCQRKAPAETDASLILGVPDERAPRILEEVHSVWKALPKAGLIVGAAANQAALREKGRHCKYLHIATHASFRQDNPMFSGIRLGDAYLNLYDLYQLTLDAELITLSGCSTGMNAVSPGDELLGLIRGLLYAGARALLLTLWDVHDQSTAEFMSKFYLRLARGESKSRALQSAVQDLRYEYPHPYYWAPFILIGKSL
jgi:CHAT domain-containing protein